MKRRTRYLVGSLLLHLLLVFLVAVVELNVFAGEDLAKNLVNTDPIVFQLQEESRPKEVVETPDDAERDDSPKDTDLVSDKSAKARNAEVRPELNIGEAFSKGEVEFRELPRNPAPLGTAGQLAENAQQAEEEASKAKEEVASEQYYVVDSRPKFTRNFLTEKQTVNPGANNVDPKLSYDNQASHVLDSGSFSFSTYEWDYAPYMLALKKRVEDHIFPPAAFYRLGIIDGTSRIRFRIHPNGAMTHLEVLNYVGHKTLMETSVRALEISVPFAPLPAHFPDEYLEVTGTFYYPNLRDLRDRKG